MLLLIIAVALGLGIGYFATQNTTPVIIRIGEYVYQDVPLYLVIVGSILMGLLVAWILYVARSLSSTWTIYGKERAVKRANQTVQYLERRVEELETENARLRAQQPVHLEPSGTLKRDGAVEAHTYTRAS
jgi:uncharacterized integral membrane protein